MVYLSAISFIFFNIILGLGIVFFVRIILFHPSKKWYIGKQRIPLTPGLVFKNKEYIFDRIQRLLDTIFNECNDYSYSSNFSRLERKIYYQIWDRLENFEQINYVPSFLINNAKKIVAQLCFEILRHFIRSFVPYILNTYNTEGYINLLSSKLDVYLLRNYYVKYVHRYLLLLSLFIFSLLGIYNSIVFLLIK